MRTPLERFLPKCVFNPITGCVLWVGGVSYGGGEHRPYPSFWNGKKTVRGHLWAASNIHGLTRGLLDHVDHECKNTLCVEHLRVISAYENTTMANKGRSLGVVNQFEGVPYHVLPKWVTTEIPIVTTEKELRDASRKKTTTLRR